MYDAEEGRLLQQQLGTDELDALQSMLAAITRALAETGADSRRQLAEAEAEMAAAVTQRRERQTELQTELRERHAQRKDELSAQQVQELADRAPQQRGAASADADADADAGAGAEALGPTVLELARKQQAERAKLEAKLEAGREELEVKTANAEAEAVESARKEAEAKEGAGATTGKEGEEQASKLSPAEQIAELKQRLRADSSRQRETLRDQQAGARFGMQQQHAEVLEAACAGLGRVAAQQEAARMKLEVELQNEAIKEELGWQSDTQRAMVEQLVLKQKEAAFAAAQSQLAHERESRGHALADRLTSRSTGHGAAERLTAGLHDVVE